jgi:2-C-methyl-D-erythritol 4-phosphate cytidylyltransferase
MAANGPGTVAAILVAAGSGERLGAGGPKAFCVVRGRTLLEHAAARFAGHPAGSSDHGTHRRVAGGATRQASVWAGLAAVGDDVDLVLVHDVARPFVPAAVIAGVVAALELGAEAAVPVVPIHDTVRRVDSDGAFAEVLDRSSLLGMQTPQGFVRTVLVRAHELGRDLDLTDDAALVEAIGVRVHAVPGSDQSFKITRPWDLAVAEAVADLD